MSKKDKKYLAMFLQDIGGIPNIVGSKKLSIGQKQISFKKKAFTVDFDNPIYSEGLEFFYFFDYNNTGQMLLNQNSEKGLMTTEMMDIICNEDIIIQLIKANEIKKNWIDMIMGCVCGIGLGLFIGSMLPKGVV